MNLGRWSNPRSGSKPARVHQIEQQIPSARRVFRPAGFFAPAGQGAHIGSGGTSHFAPLMIPKLAESVGPVAILDPLAGAFTHLLAQFWIRG
jgi:hypothetical protein